MKRGGYGSIPFQTVMMLKRATNAGKLTSTTMLYEPLLCPVELLN